MTWTCRAQPKLPTDSGSAVHITDLKGSRAVTDCDDYSFPSAAELSTVAVGLQCWSMLLQGGNRAGRGAEWGHCAGPASQGACRCGTP